jgi:hypothetical protein
MNTRGMRWQAAVLSIAVTLAIGCEKDKTGPSTVTGGSGGTTATGGGSGGSNTGGTGGSGGNIGGSSTGGAGGTSPGVDAGSSADSGSASDTLAPAVGPESFVGEWDYMSGGAQLSCPGAQPVTQTYQPSNFITFNAGAGVSPLVLALTGCNLRFDIQGKTAVVQPGQTCAIAVGSKPATRRPDVYTFAIEGNLLRETSTWTVTFTGSADPPCMLTSQGTLIRHP